MPSGFSPYYQNTFQKVSRHDVVNMNKITSEQYGDLVDQEFSKLNENAAKNQDLQSQLKIMKYKGQNIKMRMI